MMKKYLIVAIICSGLYAIFIVSIVNKSSLPYRFNKELFVTIYSVDDPNLQKQIETIKKNPKWMKRIRRDASVRGITIPKMIEKAAKYSLKNKNK